MYRKNDVLVNTLTIQVSDLEKGSTEVWNV